MLEKMEAYKILYLGFCQALAKTRLLSTVSTHALKDFPANLPDELGLAMTGLFRDFAGKLQAAVVATKNENDDAYRSAEQGILEGDEKQAADSPLSRAKSFEVDNFALSALELFISNERSTPEGFGAQFRIAARQQSMAMVFAHLDAFMNDTLRAVCDVCPQVLKSSKQIAWSKIFQFDDIKSLKDFIIDEFIREFGWKTIGGKVAMLNANLGLQIDTPEGDINLLVEFEQRRHLVIHNGGIVSAAYTEKFDRGTVGEIMGITDTEIDQLFHTAKMFGSDLCVAVCTKFYGANEESLTRIWRRKTQVKGGGVN